MFKDMVRYQTAEELKRDFVNQLPEGFKDRVKMDKVLFADLLVNFAKGIHKTNNIELNNITILDLLNFLADNKEGSILLNRAYKRKDTFTKEYNDAITKIRSSYDSRYMTIKSIAIHAGVTDCLKNIIARTNELYPDLKVKEEEFGTRLARNPEEAACIGTIIVVPIEDAMPTLEVKEKAKEYKMLMDRLCTEKPELSKPAELNKFKTWQDLEDVLNE